MLDKVKLALRISHTLLDSEIAETIEEAKAELIRSGISPDAVDENDPQICGAIKTYCLYKYANDPKMTEGYLVSFQYQMDNLRKTTGYREE